LPKHRSLPYEEDCVRLSKTLAFVVSVGVLSASAFTLVSARQTPKPGAMKEPPVEDVLKVVRADLQGNRSDIIAKNITLSTEQAAKFWPVYETYQKEQNAIMDDQMKGIQKYISTYPNLDDASALGLINAHYDRDARMNALRQKWMGEFQKILPTKTVVRVMQIDRRLSLVHQIAFASEIPLAH
jgi:Spy/CpxP family protein refolding chaperone